MTTFRTAPIPAWELRKGDLIRVDPSADETVIHSVYTTRGVHVLGDHGTWYRFDRHRPVDVKAPSGPHPIDGWATWWRTPNEFSPCTCLHRPTGVPGNWAPAGLDDGCREHAGADQWED